MLALSFLILVGFTLILESFDIHVPKGYIYFAMFFSIAVESLNLIRNKRTRSDTPYALLRRAYSPCYPHSLRFSCFQDI